MLRFFRRRRISPSISSLKWLTRHARRTHPYSSFPTTKRNMFVVPRVGRFPYRKGSKTIRARRATLFQSGSLVSRGKKTVGSRNPLEDQRGARKKCKNKIDAHAQCFHAGEFSAFVRPDLKELFWRRTRFEEEEWSARLPELIIIIKKIRRRRRRRREKGGKRSFLESRATPV